MAPRDRLDYINAVKCLRSKPAKSTNVYAPGARNRFDDFQATHILLSLVIHADVQPLAPDVLLLLHDADMPFFRQGLFYQWHRYFVWLYEKALRDECGYKGTHPYWDWTINWQDPRKRTVFDGGQYSIFFNFYSLCTEIYTAPGATGGGCIESGPFANAQTNLGNVVLQPGPGPNNGLGYNPHCVTRDISLEQSNKTKPTDVVRSIGSTTAFSNFDNDVEGPDGVHGAGHLTIGGLQYDFQASPGDPAFYLHHAA